LFEATICKWRSDASAAVSLTFDDGYEETYESTAALFGQLNISATYFIATAAVGQTLEGFQVADWDTWKQASSLGFEVGSHGLTHTICDVSLADKLTILSSSFRDRRRASWYARQILGDVQRRLTRTNRRALTRTAISDALYTELIESKRTIEKKIPQHAVASYAYPFGVYNLTLKDLVRQAGYISARSADPGLNSGTLDLYALKCSCWKDSTDLRTANSWVDGAIMDKGWLIEVHHLVTKERSVAWKYQTRFQDFRRHLEDTLSKSVWVDAQKSVAKYAAERSETYLSSTAKKHSEVSFTVISGLDPRIYDEPLTVKVRVPSNWKKARVFFDSRKEEPVAMRFQQQSKYAYFEIEPTCRYVSLAGEN